MVFINLDTILGKKKKNHFLTFYIFLIFQYLHMLKNVAKGPSLLQDDAEGHNKATGCVRSQSGFDW